MPEVPTTNTLAALQRRITELEADLSTTREVIQRLEQIAGLVRADEERRDREREEHVRDEFFNCDLAHPQEDQ